MGHSAECKLCSVSGTYFSGKVYFIEVRAVSNFHHHASGDLQSVKVQPSLLFKCSQSFTSLVYLSLKIFSAKKFCK